MKLRFAFLLFFFSASLFAQTVVTTTPTFPTQTDSIIIIFDVTNATHQNKIAGYTGQAYAHTGVTIQVGTGAQQRWQDVKGTWPPPTGANGALPVTRIGTNKYLLTIVNPRKTYLTTSQQNDQTLKITELDFVIRSADGSQQSEDVFVPIYNAGIALVLNSPKINSNYGDPMRSPYFISPGATLPISATSSAGSSTKSITLFINDVQKYQSNSSTLQYTFSSNDNPSWKNIIKIIAEDISGRKDSAQFAIVTNSPVTDSSLPPGNRIGINYGSDNSSVTLALYAPYKKNIYVLGDFNDWKVDQSYYMNRDQVTPDRVIWWITISNLTPGQEYAYQFLIDGTIRVQDPYADKILDPWNDQYISPSTYPNLKPYPTGKTESIVSVLQTGQTPYNWAIPNFTRPSKDKLVIYELLVRDFVSTHSYTTLRDTLSYFKKLGVNAIELMPINEFEGNSSWGYNPMMYFAPDKYYGTKDQLKAFIDACHSYGIAVIMDIVLNHSYGLSPMVRMYWDTTNARPAANNPWFNKVSPNPNYSWGYDFNHESNATKYFVDRVTSYWLSEYKMDGFRFDFTKGFTNTPGDGSAYDASRIKILERMANKIWSVSPTAYVILEHFTANSEEIELSKHGMMIWGNLNGSYQQATMGYPSGPPGTWDFSSISYVNRGWSQPGLVGYMESHDEERLMHKNITYGNFYGFDQNNPTVYNPTKDASGNIIYSIRELSTALNRIKLCASMFLTVPGPKMIWMGGEVGYDVSIDGGGGRLAEKPFEWNYYADATHRKLFDVFAGLIRLKKNYPAFSSNSFTISASGPVKTISITDPSMNVTIFGNFDVVTQNASFSSNTTSKWYEFFTGDSITVSSGTTQIPLQPGEYRLYTSNKLPSLNFLTDVKKEDAIPTQYALYQNYPNPFNPSTVISWQLAADSYVTLKVYDMLGREVATLVNEYKIAGKYNSQFAIRNSQLSSGVYFYTLKAGDFVQSKKMILLK